MPIYNNSNFISLLDNYKYDEILAFSFSIFVNLA